MSFSKPRLESPIKRTVELRNGEFSYYDTDSRSRVSIGLPSFVPIDYRSAVGGFSDQDNAGIWSNEVKDLRSEELIIRVGNNRRAQGTYEEVKDSIAGMKYVKIVYAIAKLTDTFEIVRFRFSGAALNAWIDKGFEPCDCGSAKQCGVEVKSLEDRKKGRVEYKCPVFVRRPLTNETRDAAVKADEVLQSWFDQYHSQVAFDHVERSAADQSPADVEDNCLSEEPQACLDEIPF